MLIWYFGFRVHLHYAKAQFFFDLSLLGVNSKLGFLNLSGSDVAFTQGQCEWILMRLRQNWCQLYQKQI